MRYANQHSGPTVLSNSYLHLIVKLTEDDYQNFI